MLVLEVKINEQIDVVWSQKLEIVAEEDKLKVEKAKFEAQWELLHEKKEELRKEAEYIVEENKAVLEIRVQFSYLIHFMY